MPPLPITLASIVLIGWPLLQLVGVILTKPKRARLRQLAEKLATDPQYGEDERRAVTRVVAEARGDGLILLAPILLPSAIIIMSIGALIGRAPLGKAPNFFDADELTEEAKRERREMVRLLYGEAGERLWSTDARFRELVDLSNDLEFERWPVSLLFTAIGLALALPFVIAAYGLQWSFRSAVQYGRRLADITRLMRRAPALGHR
jgi:hypothetical protein